MQYHEHGAIPAQPVPLGSHSVSMEAVRQPSIFAAVAGAAVAGAKAAAAAAAATTAAATAAAAAAAAAAACHTRFDGHG